MARAWNHHGYIVPSFLICFFTWGWFVTWGDWKLFVPEDFCGFYDGLARSILHGHLDVPRAAIGVEAFTFEGKAYGYFGIGPALLRIPLVLMFNGMDGLWSRLMILIAATISLICAYQILGMIRVDSGNVRAQRLLASLFVLSVGIGSTTIFLAGRSFTYHEALIWGGAFGLLFTCTILRYFERPRPGSLALAGVFAFMCFHSRPTVGVGALLTLAVLASTLSWRAITSTESARSFLGLGTVARPLRHALIAASAITLTVAVYLGVNYAKFRTFEALPLKYYDFYAQFPKRFEATRGKQIHLINVPTGIVTYFGVHGVRFKDKFPWCYPEEEATFIGSPANDVIEQFSTVPISMPALALLSVIGSTALIVGSNRRLCRSRLPAATFLVGGGIMLASVGITERYLHDFYPALVICSAAGVARLGSGKRQLPLIGLLAPLCAVSVILNCSFSLINQRENFGAPPAKVEEYQHLQRSINRALHRPPPVE